MNLHVQHDKLVVAAAQCCMVQQEHCCMEVAVCHQQSRQEHTRKHAQQAAGEVQHVLGQNGLTSFVMAPWHRWLLHS